MKKFLTVVASSTSEATTEDRLLTEAHVALNLEPTSEFLQLVDETGFTRRGRYAWSIPVEKNKGNIRTFLSALANEYIAGTVHSGMDANRAQASFSATPYVNHLDLTNNKAQPFQQAGYGNTNLTDAFRRLNLAIPTTKDAAVENLYRGQLHAQGSRSSSIEAGYGTLGGVLLSFADTVLWVRLAPTPHFVQEYGEVVQIPKVVGVQRPHKRTFSIFDAKKHLETLAEHEGEDSYDADRSADVFDLIERAENVFTVGYAAGEPSTVFLTRGSRAIPRLGRNIAQKMKNFPIEAPRKASLGDVLELQEQNPNIEFVIHPGLEDMVRMSKAKKYQGDSRLKEFQKEAVAIHLSTTLGYVNICDPGMGKSIMQLAAMRARSEQVQHYRGLIVCDANTREQWSEYAADWFPEAQVVMIHSAKDVERLGLMLAEAGPVVVIASYKQAQSALTTHEEEEATAQEFAMLRTMEERIVFVQEHAEKPLTIGRLLLATQWQDLCADEAVVIRTGTSKQNSAMWLLRQQAEVATALTGTPINRETGDLARLVAWVRNDKNMFAGIDLNDKYDTTTVKGATQLMKSFGAVVFRRDSSEVKDEMPDANPIVIKLKPSAAEKMLVASAERELKRCYMELEAALEEAEKSGGADAEVIAAAKQNLRDARGTWLGGTTLARMATSDPAAILASDSTGAALLQGQGLVEAALQDIPTKRRALLEEAEKHIAAGKQMIVFTEFATVAAVLVEALQEHGIAAAAFTGKNGAVRDRYRVAFQAGELSVLVATKAGSRGLTLHKASTIVHYDLPWTPDDLIQRTGRGIRMGAENATVDVMYLIVEVPLEERIAAIVTKRAALATMILDRSRKEDVSQTKTLQAMKGLMTSVMEGSKDQNTLAMGRILLGLDLPEPVAA